MKGKRNKVEQRSLKRILIEKYGYQCEVCGWNKTLDIHHLKSRDLNDENHCMLLCPNCHSLTPSNRIATKHSREYLYSDKFLYSIIANRKPLDTKVVDESDESE